MSARHLNSEPGSEILNVQSGRRLFWVIVFRGKFVEAAYKGAIPEGQLSNVGVIGCQGGNSCKPRQTGEISMAMIDKSRPRMAILQSQGSWECADDVPDARKL